MTRGSADAASPAHGPVEAVPLAAVSAADPREAPATPTAVGGLATGRVVVSVPASSANLGPGFDSLGLALDLRDVVEVRSRPASYPGTPGTTCRVSGEGAGEVPTDGRHLVARSVRAGLAALLPAADPTDLSLTCENVIPHGRGLGSSATAVVAGLLAAWTLVHGPAATAARRDWLVDRSSAVEGHGDNASASVLGGAVVAWCQDGRYRSASLTVARDLEIVTCVPREVLATEVARSILPERVPHADAAFTGGRAALLVEALRGRRDLLLPATADRLHQEQRAVAMPASHALLTRLRAAGIAATVSGAGPALLCLGTPASAVAALTGEGWQVRQWQLGPPASVVDHSPD